MTTDDETVCNDQNVAKTNEQHDSFFFFPNDLFFPQPDDISELCISWDLKQD